MNCILGKEEKLKSKILIQQLFTHGKRVKSYPMQLIYLPISHNSTQPISVGFSVPKRNVKLAVNRNRIKRLMREVYRKNKQIFIENIDKPYIFMFIFMDKNEPEYTDLEMMYEKLSTKFSNKIKENEQI